MEKNNLLASRLDYKDRSILEGMWQEAFRRGGSYSFKIVSGSMNPVIKVGNVVRITSVQPTSIRIGDIAAFQEGENVIVHRVIGKNRSNQQLSFRHMGDACRSSGRFLAQNLIGKVTVIKKEGNEINLESPAHAVGNKVSAWRLWLIDTFTRLKNRRARVTSRRILRLFWRFGRRLLFRH